MANQQVARFTDEKDLIVPDDVLPQQKEWKDGKSYVFTFTAEQIGRDTLYKDDTEFGGTGATRYRIKKSEASTEEDALAKRVRDSR